MSSKTLKAGAKKIKLVHKLSVLGFLSILVIAGVIIWRHINPPYVLDKVEISGHTFLLDVADTGQERVQGLSGRGNLPGNRAMLFIFSDNSEQCMWMKDMKFPLDIVWLDESEKVLKIAENVSPDTYPQAFCSENTRYVLEFNAGTVRDISLKIGQNLNF